MNAAELLRELKRTVDQLDAFNDIGKALTSTLDLNEVLSVIMQKVSALLVPDNWSLLLKSEGSDDLTFSIVVGPAAPRLMGERVKPGEGIAGWVAQSAEAALVEDAPRDDRFAARFDAQAEFQTGSILAVPMRSHGKVLGVIELVNAEGRVTFKEDDLKTLSTIADYAAIAIENARNFRKSQELTIVDEHTGLYNARHLRAVLTAEVARSQRFGRPFSVVFLDLDHFKQVNDAHGHLHGSALLREVGSLLLRETRQVDTVVRYGGDEFVVVLPETGKPPACALAERVCASFRKERFLSSRGVDLALTASFGVATYPDDAATEQELLARADEAMYRVKSATRNGVKAA
jgi:diguanylate cyclase (GGDEF)-like protein